MAGVVGHDPEAGGGLPQLLAQAVPAVRGRRVASAATAPEVHLPCGLRPRVSSLTSAMLVFLPLGKSHRLPPIR